MSIYSEMLKLVLAGDNDDVDRSVGALGSDALSSRSHLLGVRTGQPAARSGRAADRVADSLAYDAALVRLCNRLRLEQDLTGGGDTHTARVGAEARLAERLPTLAAALGGPEEAGLVDWP